MSSVNGAKASHLYGADLFYYHVSGNTYTVVLHAYGDCIGGQFPSFSTSGAQLFTYNGNTQVRTDTLILQNPTAGIEVTPVCPAQENNTSCKNPLSSIPGVKKFVYMKTITLSTTSANWRFRFTGNMINSVSAGRSGGITNIPNNGQIMVLEATLNNQSGGNSSPVYTTIPTPFFCINRSAGYNPGAVDANNDSLVYSLVAGLTTTGTVSYTTGYSATSPLSATTGTFSASSSTGQINFTPNLVQKSLVVHKVSEYKNGVLVGTSMREMTFVVLPTCTNNAPGGKIVNNNMGVIDNSGTIIKACQSGGQLTFNINTTDADNDTINASYTGLPTGASLNITNNVTKAPNGSFSWNLSNVAVGSYTFYLTYLDKGCPLVAKQTIAYTIEVLPSPTATITKTPPLCYGGATGTVTLSGKGGTSPYTYALGSGTFSSTATFTGLSATTYALYIKDNFGCLGDTNVTIIDPSPVKFDNIQTSPALCNNTATGQATVAGTGGTSPYTYALGNGTFSSTTTFTGLSATKHTFHVKDNNGCVSDTSIDITEPSPVKFGSIQLSPTLCNNTATGKAVVSGTGGTSPYTYAVGSGSFTSGTTITGLSATTHILRIKDNNGCLADTSIIITEPAPVSFSNMQITGAICHNSSTGMVVLTGTGGTNPYTYTVANGTYDTVRTFTGLPAGQHTFSVRDKNDCQKDSAVTVGQASRIKPLVAIKRTTCTPLNNGSVTMGATGGTPSYTFAIGTGSYSAQATFNSLTRSTYILHVKDKNNCVVDTTITVTDSLQLNISDNITDAQCFDSSSGSATFTVNGGVSPYSYALGPGTYTTNATFSGLGAGTYSIRVRDNIGCTANSTFTVNEPDPLVPLLALTMPACKGNNNGIISVNATGGTPAYQQALNNGTFSPAGSLTGLATGVYIVSVKDSKGCRADTTVTLKEPDGLTLKVIPKNPPCYGEPGGSVQVQGFGGTLPYTYSADARPFTAFSNITGLAAGTRRITIRDRNNCLADTTLTLTEPPQMEITSVTTKDPTCEGFADGSVTISGQGGVPPYMYAANNGPFGTGNELKGLKEGNHTISMADAKNCIIDTSVLLTGLPHIIYDDVIAKPVSCFGLTDGTISITASGGIQPLTYKIGNGNTTANPEFTGLKPGNYIFTITDAAGCLKDSMATITSPEKIVLETSARPNDCEGLDNGGSIEVIAKGGTPAYSYAWSTEPEQNGNIISGMANGTYRVTVSDANNCTDSAFATIKYDNCCLLFIPDAFTPNNDGLNDLARIKVKGEFRLRNFSIYNRFGERVFETNNMDSGWDGMYKASLQDIGTYNYYVRGICGYAGKEEVMYKGTILLIR